MEYLKTQRLWLSAGDISRELGVPKSTIYTWGAQGLLGVPLRVSGKQRGALRFHRSAVVKMIEQRLTEMAEATGIEK